MLEAECEHIKANMCEVSVEKLQIIRCDRRKSAFS